MDMTRLIIPCAIPTVGLVSALLLALPARGAGGRGVGMRNAIARSGPRVLDESARLPRSLRPGLLQLRGGWQQVDDTLAEILDAQERGPNSITSDCVFERPGAGRRSINADMLEALRDFADMPMCNQSLVAFDKRVSLRALLVIVNGSADAAPIEPVGTQALAARCLHKLCATARTTVAIDSLCRARKVAPDDLARVVMRPLAHEDPQIKWHLLDTIGLLSRDAIGTALLLQHAVVPAVLRCLWDEDTDVVLRIGRVAATLAVAPAGLTALFASQV